MRDIATSAIVKRGLSQKGELLAHKRAPEEVNANLRMSDSIASRVSALKGPSRRVGTADRH